MAPAAAGGVVTGGAAAATAVLAAGGQGWVEQVRALRSVADVNRLLHEASARERAIDAELEQLLARRGQLEQRLVEVHASTEEVRPGAWFQAAWLARSGASATSWSARCLHARWMLDGCRALPLLPPLSSPLRCPSCSPPPGRCWRC